ncbi:MAG: ABC transporter permease [Chloroflexota bacterium]
MSADLPRGRRGRFSQSIPSALEALRANKGRSVLTALGIIIGVAAVIVMVALGQGASAQVQDRLAGLGPNVLTVFPGSTSSGGVRSGAGTSTALTEDDANAIAKEISGLQAVSPVVSGNAQLVFGNQNWQSRVQGVLPEYQQIQNWQIAEGGFFTKLDNENARNVAVVGQTVVKNLIKDVNGPLGQVIRVRNVPLTVVGVLASKGSSGFQDQDDVVLIPLKTAQTRLFGTKTALQVVVQARDASATTQAQAEIISLVRTRHKLASSAPDDVSVRSSNEILSTMQGITSTLTMLLGGVAAVSLIVGGIGIMNIMLVSATERTREIGIRMAIGARSSDVLSQFLIEALFLSIMGGLIGTALGLGISVGVSQVAGWPTVFSPGAVALAFGFSAVVGVFFGFYPARKASMLNPIDALRHE